jgi:hypothetical protein
MRQRNRQRHQFGRLVARKSNHHTLIARAYRLDLIVGH